MTEQKAKVFWSGRSQAVRIPKQFRFDTDEVTIRKEGDVVILEPVSNENQPIDFEKEWGWLQHLKKTQASLRRGRKWMSSSSEVPARYQCLHCIGSRARGHTPEAEVHSHA